MSLQFHLGGVKDYTAFMLVDSHAHLEAIKDLDGELERAQEVGVGKIITVGTTIAESENAANLALSCSRPGLDKRTTGLEIYATCGIHPKDGAGDVEKFGINESIHRLRTIAKSSRKIVAIGECGLDYYLGVRGQSLGTSEKEKTVQRELFEAQMELAAELNLPLVIHCRDGWDEIFDILKTSIESSLSRRREVSLKTNNNSNGKFSLRSNSKLRGAFHSWTGDWQAARKALDLGFYISFSGIVTFKNAKDVQEVAKKAPLDRILVETDSPFLSPEPVRAKTNEPGNVKIIAEFIAKLRNQSIDLIASRTSLNAQKLLRI